MHVILAAIGKLKSGPELALFEHYVERLSWKLSVREYEFKKSAPEPVRKEKEGELLLAGCRDAEHLIALDERGEALGSVAFAGHLRKVRDGGCRTLAFMIGGADGLAASVTARAQLLLSFGRLTWPHMLMRGLLAEQLFRAQSILAGHPYHRE